MGTAYHSEEVHRANLTLRTTLFHLIITLRLFRTAAVFPEEDFLPEEVAVAVEMGAQEVEAADMAEADKARIIPALVGAALLNLLWGAEAAAALLLLVAVEAAAVLEDLLVIQKIGRAHV